MTSLYEIDQEIMSCVDLETGEILNFERLEALQIERNQKCENVALWIKNLLSDAEQIKIEKDKLAEREKTNKEKAEKLKQWLAVALSETKFTTAKVAVTFRSSESVEIENESAFIEAAQNLNHDDWLSYKPPTPNKTAIKAAIKAGSEIKGASLVKKQNIQIR